MSYKICDCGFDCGREMKKSLAIILMLAISPLYAAPAFVQSTSCDGCTSLAYASNVTAASMLAVAFRCGGIDETPVFTDTLLNSYSEAIKNFNSDSAVSISYALNTSGGANTVAAAGCVAGSKRWFILEYSGVATASALDQTNGASGSGVNATSGNITPTTDGELILGAAHSNNQTDLSADSPFTGRTASLKIAAEDYIQPTAAAIQAAFSQTSDGWGCVVATFKAAGGGGGGGAVAPQNRILMQPIFFR